MQTTRADRTVVRDRLTELRAAGVQGMYFRIDLYHQEFVPAERVSGRPHRP